MNVTSSRASLLVLSLALLVSAAATAQDQPTIDLALVGHSVTQSADGVTSLSASLHLRACGAQELSTEVTLESASGFAAAAVEIVIEDGDIGGTCANTRNGSCTGVACPDAIINGKRRKGTCSDGSMGGLCVCDYGVVGISLDSVFAAGEAVLFVDAQHTVQEMSEENNFQNVDLGQAERILAEVAELADGGVLENRSSSGVDFTELRLEVSDGGMIVAQQGADAFGACHSSARLLSDTGLLAAASHSCTGDPCSSCEFVRNAANEITGCKCVENPNNHSLKCNHSISTKTAIQLKSLEAEPTVE